MHGDHWRSFSFDRRPIFHLIPLNPAFIDKRIFLLEIHWQQWFLKVVNSLTLESECVRDSWKFCTLRGRSPQIHPKAIPKSNKHMSENLYSISKQKGPKTLPFAVHIPKQLMGVSPPGTAQYIMQVIAASCAILHLSLDLEPLARVRLMLYHSLVDKVTAGFPWFQCTEESPIPFYKLFSNFLY